MAAPAIGLLGRAANDMIVRRPGLPNEGAFASRCTIGDWCSCPRILIFSPSPEQAARARAAQSMMASLHSPQRVDLSISAAEADLQMLRERGAALKTFYAVLTAAQQATFDRRTLPDEGQ